MSLEALVIVLAYLAVLAVLAVFGAHRLHLVWILRRAAPPGPPPPEPREWPAVTVQLPVFNEATCVERLLDAVARFDYPRERLEVQVLDDSTDETTTLLRAHVARLRAGGLDVRLVHRNHRAGFKAGALAAGLRRARGELIAIFDADFVPDPDFLRRTVPHFSDPEVGLVQARWGHLNREQNLLTRLQAMALDAHFRIEHHARSRSGRFFNFNGTAGVFRRAAIEDAGGWSADTITEDLDLSLRAQLCGWTFRYLDEVVVPAELPATVTALRVQQQRWTRGGAQTARKLLPHVWRVPDVPLRARIEATFQLVLGAAYPCMFALCALSVPLVWSGYPHPLLSAVQWALVGLASGAVALFYLVPYRGSLLGGSLTVVALFACGLGLSLNNGWAFLAGLGSRRAAFVRTPKRGGRRGERYRASRVRWVEVGELLVAAYLAVGVAHAGAGSLATPLLALACAGFGALAWATLAGRRQAWLARSPEAAPAPDPQRVVVGAKALEEPAG
ncbi:MAG: glycosyltransferase family 2 protein [Planctomycetes bacterium]|nr:glycosyltransferase family 2 protein [Planctomycetota bacterium]